MNCCAAVECPEQIGSEAGPPDTKQFKPVFVDAGDYARGVHSTCEGEFVERWNAAFESMEARSRIEQYLASRGCEQRQARNVLVDWFNTARSPDRHVDTLLHSITETQSEPRLEAAIDLLTLLGRGVINRAMQTAAWPSYRHSAAAYALAVAAGRLDTSLISVFQNSLNDACREAAITLVDDLPADEAVPILRQLAADTNPSIRRLADMALND